MERISRDLEVTANMARRRFDESVGSRTIKTSFDVLTSAEMMASLIRADDILTIIEPTHPGESITRQFTGLFEAAFETAAAILVVPRRNVRTSGPILVVASGPDDVSIRVALEIAAALKERLIVVTRFGALPSADVLSDAKQLGVQVEQIAANGLVADMSSLASSPQVKERLRVVTRSSLPDDGPRLFSMLHGVPLLLVEPYQAHVAADER
jgi:hypothetical protein